MKEKDKKEHFKRVCVSLHPLIAAKLEKMVEQRIKTKSSIISELIRTAK